MINGEISHWWHQIGAPQPRPALSGDIVCDVAIVGAGYTGLWAAYYLKQARPDLNVVVVEQNHVGYGASGRNGGWLTNAITGGRQQYVASHGVDAAERFQYEMNNTVDEVIRVAKAEGIDADIRKGGEFNVAYTPAQEARLRAAVEDEQGWKHTDVELLERDQATARINVANTRAAVWHPHAARVQPAKLVTGIAKAVERLGVTIYEGTTVTEIQPRKLRTSHGTVQADAVVRATEGFTTNLKGLKRLWLPMNSSLIATEPLSPNVWDELNWSNGEVLGDFAHVYMYAQRTADDRLAFGGRGVPYRFGSGTDDGGVTQQATADKLSELLFRFFPAARGAAIGHLWSGVLGVPRDWAATVGFDPDSGMAWAGGYVGTGVTSTNLAGRTIRDLVLGLDTELVTLPWVNHRVRKWEPEPLRWIATRGLYRAYGLADHRELQGGFKTPWIAKAADVITGKK